MRILYTPFEYLELSGELLVLYFTASWCAPCKLFEPKVAALEALYPQVLFAKVDVEDAVELADSFSIKTLPTVILVKQGQEAHRTEGVAHKRPSRPVSLAIRRHLLCQSDSTVIDG